MIDIDSYEKLEEKINTEEKFLLYISAPDCGVCNVDKKMTEEILKNYDIKSYNVDISNVPMVSGQMGIFTSPAILLFFEKREIFRQARFLDFKEVEYRISQIADKIKK